MKNRNGKPYVSIIIKALNEEDKIAKAIESALLAASHVDGEVILADSLSTDKTVEIASNYPIKIVQLNNPADRSCGVGAQLGYLYADGDFIYVMDGDMELFESFLPAAVQAMIDDKALGGVGGIVTEANLEGIEYRARQQRCPPNMQPGLVDRLNMGGLYRRKAIESVGYLTNPNLHSYEEFELAIRLKAVGWKLVRIPRPAVKHYGHTIGGLGLLKRRWASRYTYGIGELLRASFGKPHFRYILKDLTEFRLYIAVIFWWFAMAVCLLFSITDQSAIAFFFTLLSVPLVVMTLKKRSLTQALYSVVSWNYYTAGLIMGILQGKGHLTVKVPSSIIRDSGSDTALYEQRHGCSCSHPTGKIR